MLTWGAPCFYISKGIGPPVRKGRYTSKGPEGRLAPRVPISGGKPLPKKNKGTGATRVAGVLRMAALSLKHSDTALGAYFRRIARRKNASVAIFASARKLAIFIYRMLKYGQDYIDEGAQAYQERFRQRRLRSLTSIAKSMGYQLLPVDAST